MKTRDPALSVHSVEAGPGLCKLKPMGQIGSPRVFVNTVWNTITYVHLHIICGAFPSKTAA